MYFIAQIKRNYTNLMILSIWPFNSNNEGESKLNENNKPEKNPKEELINLDTVIKLDKEKLLNLTNKELLSYSKEERLKYITEGNIDYSKVKSGEVKEITFLFGDGKDKKELFKKTTVGQVLGKEISEIRVGEIIYKRNGLDGEFFDGNRRLRIFTGTKVEIVKIREKNELNELKINFDNEFNKKVEEFKINEKYKETIDKNSDIIEESVKRGIKVEMIYDLFSGILSSYSGNERKIKLEDLFTEIDRIRSRYGLEENSEKLIKYLKDDNNDGELDEIKMHYHYKDINLGEIGTIGDFISIAEGTHGNYNAIYGNGNQDQIKFTDMTIQEIIDYQNEFGKSHKSTAIGKYQIINDTLIYLVDKYGFNKNQKFSPEIQDELAMILLKNRGLDKYKSGELSIYKFQENLSAEWASIPKNEKGKSYYDGDGLNNATVSHEDTIAAIEKTIKIS